MLSPIFRNYYKSVNETFIRCITFYNEGNNRAVCRSLLPCVDTKLFTACWLLHLFQAFCTARMNLSWISDNPDNCAKLCKHIDSEVSEAVSELQQNTQSLKCRNITLLEFVFILRHWQIRIGEGWVGGRWLWGYTLHWKPGKYLASHFVRNPRTGGEGMFSVDHESGLGWNGMMHVPMERIWSAAPHISRADARRGWAMSSRGGPRVVLLTSSALKCDPSVNT